MEPRRDILPLALRRLAPDMNEKYRLYRYRDLVRPSVPSNLVLLI
jgi:hypothetical protein